MLPADIYLSSPLCSQTVSNPEGCALLLQFILSEFFQCIDWNKKENPIEFLLSKPACFFPFDLSSAVGCLNKIEEHSHLLSDAFPEMMKEIGDFQATLKTTVLKVIDHKNQKKKISHSDVMGALSRLYQNILPFLIACKESENLVLFLLRHSEKIQLFSQTKGVEYLIEEMFPTRNFDEVRKRYDIRGFSAEIAEFDELVTYYERQ